MDILDTFEKLSQLTEVNHNHIELLPQRIKQAYKSSNSMLVREALSDIDNSQGKFVDMVEVVRT